MWRSSVNAATATSAMSSASMNRSDAMKERGPPLLVGSAAWDAAGFLQLPVLREAPVEREYVGIDYHRRRSVLVRRDEAGASLGMARVVNDPLVLAAELAKAGPEPDVVIEATYGWYWVVDLLREQGAQVHLAHPLGNNLITGRS